MRLRAICCEVLARQAYFVASTSQHVIDIELVDKGLHEEPDQLRAELQRRLDTTDPERYDAVLLGYGLCSNATAGLTCAHAPMILPRAHDCITLYLGSRERYGQEFGDHPGTFWYTPDYIERGGSGENYVALGSSDDANMAQVYEEYVAKYGQDNADYLMEVMGAWKQHYDRAAYIDTPDLRLPDYRGKVREMADRRGWHFEEMAGSLVILRMLFEGDWHQERFLTIPPGETITPTHDHSVVRCGAFSR